MHVRNTQPDLLVNSATEFFAFVKILFRLSFFGTRILRRIFFSLILLECLISNLSVRARPLIWISISVFAVRFYLCEDCGQARYMVHGNKPQVVSGLYQTVDFNSTILVFQVRGLPASLKSKYLPRNVINCTVICSVNLVHRGRPNIPVIFDIAVLYS